MSTNSVTFKIPEELNATCAPERRGTRRDHVRLMFLNKQTGSSQHDQFYNLKDYLKPGDVLVFNNSRTVPAILKGTIQGETKEIEVRLARKSADDTWEALIVDDHYEPGAIITFTKKLRGLILSKVTKTPFSVLQFSLSGTDLWNEIFTIGEPVRYEYIHEPWPLSDYQTIYGSVPGSVEMASAGRAFSWELLFILKKSGIQTAHLQLHTGLSYLLDDYWHIGPAENTESYNIPLETVKTIHQAKTEGRKVIAVGTTVVRALESAALNNVLVSGSGTTNLHIDRHFELKVVDGLITGFHEPEASHLDLLTAFIDDKKLESAYQEALRERYLWHEFGDVNLIL